MPPGTRLGRYLIVGELGTGGMATVYEGKALSVGGFSRRVAIKYLHPHLLRDEQFVQMFLDEGRLAAQIHHPNVVPVLDLVSEPGCMYLVSEFVEGDQLLGLMRAARELGEHIPVPIVLRILLDVLAGLHAAHELTADDGTPLRIVHRDVSPHNILVGADGITRIVDFGIAKAEERISTTREGIVKGKLSYMAPEQPDDLPVDRRADIFSAAIVLWECLTRQRLFSGRTDREVLEKLLHKPIPRVRHVAPELPEALDEAVARALERDPERRYMLASEFAQAIESAVGTNGVATVREVAAFVERVASRKLAAERARRRRLTAQELPPYREQTPSQVRAVAMPPPPALRTQPGLGPRDAPTLSPDEAPTTLSAPHAIQPLRGVSSLDEAEPLTRVQTPAARVAVAAPSPTSPVLGSHGSTTAGGTYRFLPLVVLLVGSVLGYGVWLLLQPARPRVVAPPTAVDAQRLVAPAVVAPPSMPSLREGEPPPPSPPPPLAVAQPPSPPRVASPQTMPRPAATGQRSPRARTPVTTTSPSEAPRPEATGFELPRGI
jgi:serine/threonine-protein kinase